MRSLRTLALAATLLAAGTLMSGCLISAKSRTYQSGAYIGPGMLSQVEPGKTDQEFVLATMGPPSSQTSLTDGLELWRWEYTRRRTSTGAVFLLLASDSHTESKVTTQIVFRDGIVERVWQD